MAQLISGIPSNHELAGTTAVVWNIKDYKDNSAKISSGQYILFIGNDDLIKDKRAHMNLKFNKFNMKYGWLGRQASLNVGYTISIKEFKEFKKYYEEVMNKDLSEFNSFYKDILLPMVVGSAAPIVMSLNYRKKMREDLYSCLTYIFFRDGLSEFLAD